MCSIENGPDKVKTASQYATKVNILLAALIGAGIGWCLAAIVFLKGADELMCVLISLGTMLLPTLYAARANRALFPRICGAILLGGYFVSLLSPVVSERLADRVELVLRGFRAGQFSDVPWGVAGAMLFLTVLIWMAPNLDRQAYKNSAT